MIAAQYLIEQPPGITVACGNSASNGYHNPTTRGSPVLTLRSRSKTTTITVPREVYPWRGHSPCCPVTSGDEKIKDSASSHLPGCDRGVLGGSAPRRPAAPPAETRPSGSEIALTATIRGSLSAGHLDNSSRLSLDVLRWSELQQQDEPCRGNGGVYEYNELGATATYCNGLVLDDNSLDPDCRAQCAVVLPLPSSVEGRK